MNTKRKVFWVDGWLLCILAVAAFLRMFHLSSLTEFLGDQGRTMLIMDHFVRGGVIPLVGPLTLTGHNLGPVFYYLLFPGYLISSGPLGVSWWMAFLGVVSVYLMYETARIMFHRVAARYLSFLWAVSPVIVVSDRVIWEPNLVPLFSLLFIYLLYRAYREWRPWQWAALGAVIGVLIQLHYPNIYFAGLTGLCFVGVTVFRLRPIRDAVYAAVLCGIGTTLCMLPFLWHEYTVGFRDILGIASIMGTNAAWPGKRVIAGYILDYAFRVFGRMVPNMSRPPAAVLLILTGIFVAMWPNKKNLFFLVWLVGGLFAMIRYTGVVHDHYLFFLVPVPFLFVGSALSGMKHPVWKMTAYMILLAVSGYQLMRTDVFHRGSDDIFRVSEAVKHIQSKTGAASFSFTLIGSRSFSDLHYRYYMSEFGLKPVPAVDATYGRLFVICDGVDCPSVGSVTSISKLPILCYEEHCRETYPSIPFSSEWKYVRDDAISKAGQNIARIYEFVRR